MKRLIPLIALALLATYAAREWHPDDTAASRRLPAPIESTPGERADYQARRREWIETLHRAAPGVDWRAQDAEFRRTAMAERMQQAALLRRVGAPAQVGLQVRTRAVSGQWVERGSGNIAGRTLATEFDVAANRLNVLTHGGNLWRADRTLLNWSSPADGASFTPRDTYGFLERLTGPERLLVLSDAPSGVYRSDDGGATWQAATGFATSNFWYATDFAVRDPAGTEVYALRNEFSTSFRPRLYASTNRGASFTGLGFTAARDQAALFSPRYNSSTMYLLDGLQLFTITPATHALVPVSTVPAAALASTHSVTLSGGVEGANTFLFVFIERASVTEVWRSLDGGVNWTRRTDAPTTMFGLNSAESSTRDPLRLYVGGVDAYRSHDGGQSWQIINPWQQYYGMEATRLHADVPNIDVFVDAGNVERVYISTDGGTYESLDGAITVQNLSLAGLRNAQYYGSYTVRTPPHAILAGAQDQGYQKESAPVAGINDFVQVVSGDYAHLSSSNNGGNLWMVYPGFVQLDTAPATGTFTALREWQFGTNNFQDWLFLPPLEADPLNPNRALLAGGGIGANRNRVLTLTYNGASISHSEGSFDFGSRVTDVQYSRDGLTRYVINDAGQFWRDSGAGFTLRSSGLPDGQFFYGNCILVHATTPGTLYVAGAGYSNPGVYRSTTNGDSFTPFATGLPSTLVYHLAMSADGMHLFAATELGPYYYDTATSAWIAIGATQAPDQIYWHVDYIDALQIARFSTYGRGIWDFVLGGDSVFYSGFEG
ncbi:MAG: hypothetical protein DYH17_09115 [Xanthomonadales bacterium PRO6]|nr:hypothetical protein [Xanthomonadales bacterium]MCE7931523.1 hypothetical protein [Xanthomonadales bacterium PRO6]